jgi:polysaccharide biosynthesis/export protein
MALDHRSRCAVALLVVALTGSIVAGQSAPKIAPRDQLSIAVFGVPALSGKYPVGVDGTITFPHLGPVAVAGHDTRAVEVDLTKRLKDGGYLVSPQVTVELAQSLTKRVIVTGAVRSPGPHPYAGELTLFEALALAGSTTPDAGDLALVIRASGSGADTVAAPARNADEDATNGAADGVIEISLSELESGNFAANNITVQDGDHVVVPRAQQVFISGQVRSPGAYSVPAGTSVLQAITLAGGLNDRGTFRGIRILRDKKELKNVKQDTVVKPGDTIIVKASPF